MLRKLISTLACTLPLTCWGWGTGYYVGAGLGGDFINFNEDAYVKQSPNQNFFSAVNTVDKSAQGVFGTLFGGYSWKRQRLYMAVEGNLNASTAQALTINKEFDHLPYNLSTALYQLVPTWGLSGIAGMMFPETTLVYARFGYSGARLLVETTDTSLANADNILAGVRFGFGVEKWLWRNLSARMEYDHTQYQGSTIFHIDESNGAITPKQTILTPSSNDVEFSLIYRFC